MKGAKVYQRQDISDLHVGNWPGFPLLICYGLCFLPFLHGAGSSRGSHSYELTLSYNEAYLPSMNNHILSSPESSASAYACRMGVIDCAEVTTVYCLYP